MRQIRDKYLQKRPGTDICSDMRHTYTSMAGYLASINVMSSILLYTYILKGNLCRAQAHRDWIFITLISPNNNVCRPSQDMVFFQITGDRVTITNYWISHNTCNTLLPRLIKTQQQSNTLDGWHTIYHIYHIFHLYHEHKINQQIILTNQTTARGLAGIPKYPQAPL